MRGGFVALLNAKDGIEVVGEADNGEQAARMTHVLGLDVVLMDIRMPILDGLAATRVIAEVGRGARGSADHVRARRVRLRGAALRRDRIPGRAHRTG
ncbi:response regulator transcription factor [Nocardia asiatica]|uniref:response regulator transcription factor n=1 Tax=Nocardia asiatica TaxID=209252 RepID=UPI001FE20CE6|nr:response regulator [Nocardia asiatica]